MIMRKMLSGLSAAAVLLCVCTGCSVKEDRTACPGRLLLDFSGVDAACGALDLLVTAPDGVILRDVVTESAFEDEYVREVPHGFLNVNVWNCAQDYIDEAEGIVIPFGKECPPVYMQSFTADTRGEMFCKEVRLHKNYCRLTLKMAGRQTVPYSLTVRGNVDGYGLDGKPRKGRFQCIAYPDGNEGEMTVCVPRQTDSSLMLDVDDGYAVKRSFAIGEYIRSSGYDWDSENLGDVTVTLDYFITNVTVIVQKWDEEYVFDLIL